MPRIFSGIQPSGDLHIGNWLGAVQNWVALQERNECFFSIVDLHAITGLHDPATLQRRTIDMAIGLLAAGVDPSRATLFVQSHVPEHAELMWLLTSVTPLGELERMTQFKDKSQKMESVPAGIFSYPILMAADILLYRAEQVPVGDDQIQHLELARVIARRWNKEYAGGSDFFPEPQSLLTPAKRILGLDGQAKMSKSLGNTIGILESPEEIWQKLRPAMTDPARKTKKDPGTPEICNIYALHRYFSPAETVAEVARKCRGAEWGCLDCKRVLADNMAATLAPIRERAAALRADEAAVHDLLAAGAARARAEARKTLDQVKAKMGFLDAQAV